MERLSVPIARAIGQGVNESAVVRIPKLSGVFPHEL